jgi:hydroxymethylbilane synthase
MFPAVGQGALGLECRVDDAETLALLASLNDTHTRWRVLAERAMLRGLGGGCQVPIGALTQVAESILTLRGVVLPPDGTQRVEAEIKGPMENAETLGRSVADQLRSLGADELLK